MQTGTGRAFPEPYAPGAGREGGGAVDGGHLTDDGPPPSASPPPWGRGLVRVALPVIGVAALVALAASGAGVLLPAADDTSPTGAVRVAGLIAAGLGIAALVAHRRRNRADPAGGADPTAVALATAALVMGLLTLISLPTSNVHIGEGATRATDDAAPGGSGGVDRSGPRSTAAPGSTTTGPMSASGSGGLSGPIVTGDLTFTVAVDHETGDPVPVAIDSANGRMFALDPATGHVRGMSLTPAASDGTDGSGGFGAPGGSGPGPGTSGLTLVVGVDSRTGAAGIVGVTDPDTGEVGIVHEMAPSDLVGLEPDGAVLIKDGGHIVGLDLDAAVDDTTRSTDGPGSDRADRSGVDGDHGNVHEVDLSDFDFSSYTTDDPPSIGSGGRIADLERALEQWNAAETFESVSRSQLEQAIRDADEQSRDRSSDEEDADTGGDNGDAGEKEDSGWFSLFGIELPEPGLPDPGDLSWGSGLLAGLLAAVVLAVAAAYALQLLTRPKAREKDGADGGAAEGAPLAAEEAEAGLVASLDEAQESGDPRQRIMAAYLRLLEALAAAGAPRRLEEAPHEHLSRVLGPLGVRPEPVHELAELFVLARFGNAPVTDEHRHASVTALETSLADLRAAVGPLVEEGATPAAPGAPAGGVG